MHSLGGEGLGTNYFGWASSPFDSTGSGSLFNLGFLYENTLSGILGKAQGSVMPEVTLNVFGLFADITLDLPRRVSDHARSHRAIQVRRGRDGPSFGVARTSCSAGTRSTTTWTTPDTSFPPSRRA